ncbi:MAG TPA: ATP-binding protein [Geminicoccus sp.]|uniref:ATP-binding protein n=1 Tax=Geminicoccus sp. TaxID=2024832 RepID=UPI002E32470F|nr:ATP-binding protein [Geminicoccus sp.]HEX2526665.1 ATP-binding protein [Geminicoccus sp.]
MKIRTILSTLVLFLGTALLVSVALNINAARRSWSEAQRSAIAERVRSELTQSAATLARERGQTYLELHKPDAINLDAVAELQDLRRTSNVRLRDALKGVKEPDIAPFVPRDAIATVASKLLELDKLRSQIDRLLSLPRTNRPNDIGDQWFSAVTDLIASSQDLRFALLRALPTADRLLADNRLLRRFGWIVGEQAEQGQALLAGAMAENRRPTDREFARVAVADARIDLAWDTVRDIARAGMPPSIIDSVVAAQRSYFNDLMKLREQIYSAARRQQPYPVTAEQWFDQAGGAIDTLNAIQTVSAQETYERVAELLARAKRNLFIWALIGLLGALAVVFCLFALEKRVLRPLRELTTAIGRLSERDTAISVPKPVRGDELGAMAKALRSSRANMLWTQRLRAARDRLERQTTQAIRDREIRLQAMFDSVSDGIMTLHHSTGVIESMNMAASRIFALDPETTKGRQVTTILPDLDVRNCVAKAKQDSEGDRLLGVPHEIVGLRSDGSVIPIEATLVETPLASGSVFTVSLRDITERKKVDRMKSEFISTVSHELRTPLTSIRGSLDLLLNTRAGDLSQQARYLVDMARRNAERLLLLVNDILDVERIESGQLSFSFQTFDLVPLIRSAIETNQNFAISQGVKLSLVQAPESSYVSGDPDRLMQVMANLLSNAAKFSGQNANVTVEVIEEGDFVRTVIHDTGPGIPPDFHSRIFQKFAQADSSDNRKQSGTGLGLSISKAIVERHGGRIGFASRPGSTQFFFRLPRVAMLPDLEEADPAHSPMAS